MNASARHAAKSLSQAETRAESRSAKLRQMLQSPELEFLMEAHKRLVGAHRT